jgi:hypothetical protein
MFDCPDCGVELLARVPLQDPRGSHRAETRSETGPEGRKTSHPATG